MIAVILTVLFVFGAITVGRDGTAKALIGIMGNVIVLISIIFFIWIGVSGWIAVIAGCVFMALISLFYQNGVNEKTKTAFLSVGIMMICLGVISYFVIKVGNLQGFPVGQFAIRESNGYLGNVGVDFLILQVGVVLIMLEGAMVDTSISVASSMEEVGFHSSASKDELFRSGMAVGRGILSSTINTLFFIFLGQNLIFFLFFKNDYTWVSMLNSKVLAQELAGMLMCAIGCVSIIPVTAFIGSKFLERK
ncbi:MAG: YibE/F family protein [Clostridiales bacterium]|nr:YibE/F family protein [Clostridiales bacterium]MDD7348006.1 YibE/F family protein [Clostridiales bacterium]MDY4060567.1 YibE/F family protein [Anaerovoracaceae bacterium]